MKVVSGKGSVVRNTLGSILVLLAAACATAPKPAMLDLKITNGRIIDGTGAPWYRGDVGIRGDTIVSIGDLSNVDAANTIDARDNVVVHLRGIESLPQ